jgi:Flp pilus assembly pilin Flp
MLNYVEKFFREEDGLGTVEIVIIIAVLVGLALIFRKQIYALVNQIFDRIFGNVGDTTDIPESIYMNEKSIN